MATQSRTRKPLASTPFAAESRRGPAPFAWFTHHTLAMLGTVGALASRLDPLKRPADRGYDNEAGLGGLGKWQV